MIGELGQKFDKVLLIDDAIGSGATLNETAMKLKETGMAKEVIGFAIVGSMKGFEVIREV
jgi:predicted amidophosphoribosyltransferase